MNIKKELLDGIVLVIEDEKETMKVVIDMETSEVLHTEFSERFISINQLSTFITKAREDYRRMAKKEAMRKFIQGEE